MRRQSGSGDGAFGRTVRMKLSTNLVRAKAVSRCACHRSPRCWRFPESNPLAPFLYKRKSFEHEREVKAVIPLTDLKQILRGKEAGKSPGVWHKVELNSLARAPLDAKRPRNRIGRRALDQCHYFEEETFV